jgi:hypothetical protein
MTRFFKWTCSDRVVRLLGLLVLFAGLASAQRELNQFIDDTQVQDIWLDLPPSNWSTLLQNYESDTYYQATFTWNSNSFAIGIRQHGGASRSPIKPNLDLNFAHITKTQTFLGEGFLILKANNEDPSDLREWISMKLFRQMGMPAPRESFARLYVNGQYFGFYMIVEHEDETFLQRNFGESGGYLYEWENQGDNYDFNNLGTNPLLYANYLELKTDQLIPDLQTFANLVQVINQPSSSSFTAAQFISALSQYLDPKYFLLYAATENAVAEADGLVGGLEGMNNFDLYQFQGTSFYQLVPWDKDLTFSSPQRDIFDGSMVGATACANACPPGLINVLAQRLMAIPEYQNFYLEQLTRAATLMGGTGGWADSEITREYGVINASASNDPFKQCFANGVLYSCGEADFQSNVAWLHSFLSMRSDFVLSAVAAAGYQAPTADPVISSVVLARPGGTSELAPGALVNVNGANLGPSAQASAAPFPRILGDTYVAIEGVRAPIVITSSGQIEVQTPWDLPLTSASVVVSVNGEMSNTSDLNVVQVRPQPSQ